MNHVKAWHRLADGYDVTTVRIDAGGEPVEEREPTFVREASILVRARELWEQAASATGSMTTGSPSVISSDDVRRRPHQRPDAGRDRRSAANGCRQLQAAVIGTGVVTVGDDLRSPPISTHRSPSMRGESEGAEEHARW